MIGKRVNCLPSSGVEISWCSFFCSFPSHSLHRFTLHPFNWLVCLQLVPFTYWSIRPLFLVNNESGESRIQERESRDWFDVLFRSNQIFLHNFFGCDLVRKKKTRRRMSTFSWPSETWRRKRLRDWILCLFCWKFSDGIISIFLFQMDSCVFFPIHSLFVPLFSQLLFVSLMMMVNSPPFPFFDSISWLGTKFKMLSASFSCLPFLCLFLFIPTYIHSLKQCSEGLVFVLLSIKEEEKKQMNRGMECKMWWMIIKCLKVETVGNLFSLKVNILPFVSRKISFTPVPFLITLFTGYKILVETNFVLLLFSIFWWEFLSWGQDWTLL